MNYNYGANRKWAGEIERLGWNKCGSNGNCEVHHSNGMIASVRAKFLIEIFSQFDHWLLNAIIAVQHVLDVLKKACENIGFIV